MGWEDDEGDDEKGSGKGRKGKGSKGSEERRFKGSDEDWEPKGDKGDWDEDWEPKGDRGDWEDEEGDDDDEEKGSGKGKGGKGSKGSGKERRRFKGKGPEFSMVSLGNGYCDWQYAPMGDGLSNKECFMKCMDYTHCNVFSNGGHGCRISKCGSGVNPTAGGIGNVCAEDK